MKKSSLPSFDLSGRHSPIPLILLSAFLLIYFANIAFAQCDSANRVQWQPKLEGGYDTDRRLEQPVRIEIMGRSANSALKILSEKTGVKLAVAPEEINSTGENPSTKPLIQWNPSESHSGGAQCDSRLDRPVRIWQTAIPLSSVLEEIWRQTGVAIRLYSEGEVITDSGRIRLNLYLNPKEPPSLRSVLAQLSWVLDFTIAYRPARMGVDVHYDILCLPRSDALVALTKAMSAATKRHDGSLEEQRQRIAAQLERYRDALALSLEELVARYWDVDDALLVDLADPARREVIAFIFALPADQQQALARGRVVSLQWEDLIQNDRSILKAAFPPLAARVAKVDIQATTGGTFVSLRRPQGTPAPPGAEEHGWGKNAAPPLHIMRALEDLNPQSALSCMRALGKVTTQAEEEDYLQKFAQRKKEIAANYRAKEYEEKATHQRALEILLPSMEERLSSIKLPVGADSKWLKPSKDGYALWTLWEIQQSVATAAGVNIISDCYWQPRRPLLQPSMSANNPYLTPPPSQITALQALRGATFGGFIGGGDLSRLPLNRYPQRPAWEWGDAGTFLRFRSTDRVIFQGSLLPADVVAQLDKAYELSAAASPAGQARAAPFDLKKLAAISRKLGDLQFLFGGFMAYGDPADDKEAAQQEFRFTALMPVGIEGSPSRIQLYLWHIRFLSLLTEKQWTRLGSTGLAIGKDLSPNQQSTLMTGLRGKWFPNWAPKEVFPDRSIDAQHFYESVLKVEGATPSHNGIFQIRLMMGDKVMDDFKYDHPMVRPSAKAVTRPKQDPISKRTNQ